MHSGKPFISKRSSQDFHINQRSPQPGNNFDRTPPGASGAHHSSLKVLPQERLVANNDDLPEAQVKPSPLNRENKAAVPDSKRQQLEVLEASIEAWNAHLAKRRVQHEVRRNNADYEKARKGVADATLNEIRLDKNDAARVRQFSRIMLDIKKNYLNFRRDIEA